MIRAVGKEGGEGVVYLVHMFGGGYMCGVGGFNASGKQLVLMKWRWGEIWEVDKINEHK